MEEEPQLPEQYDEYGSPRPRPGAGIAAFVAFVAVLAFGIWIGVAEPLGSLLLFVGIPVSLAWFVWHVFLRKLWRIWRMRNAQEKRELLEAAMRGRSGPEDSSGTNPR